MSISLTRKMLLAKGAVLSALTIAAIGLVPTLGAAPKEPALVLTGKSSEYGGVKFKVCSKAINIKDNLGMELWLAAEPDCSRTLNPENNTYYMHPLAKGRLGDTPTGFKGITKVELLDKAIVCGLHCNHYLGYRELVPGQQTPCVEFWCLEKSQFGPVAHRAWCSLFVIPPQYGFPVQILGSRGHRWVHTFTLVSAKESDTSDMVFQVPPLYKEVKDKAALLFGGGGDLKSGDVEDLFAQPVK